MRGALNESEPNGTNDAGDDLWKEFNTPVSAACPNEFAAAAIGLLAGLSRRLWVLQLQTIRLMCADTQTLALPLGKMFD